MLELNFDELDMLSPLEKFREKITGANLKPDSKILLVTHNDLDGSGPSVLFKSIFPKTEIIHCTNSSMDNEIMKALYNARKYDAVFITDISCSKETAGTINNHYNRKMIYLLDHHKSAEWLNEYDWAFVCSDHIKGSFLDKFYGKELEKSSATSITYDFLKLFGFTKYIKNPALAEEFAFMVSSYDTWDWVNVFEKEQRFMDLNTIFWLYQPEVFDKIYTQKLSDENAEIIDKRERFSLMLEKNRIKQYIDSKKESFRWAVLQLENGSYNVIYCYADNHLSELFEEMKTSFQNGDIAIINTGTKLSFRSIKAEINVEKIARTLGGGGHINASGAYISVEIQNECMEKALAGKLMII